MKKTLAIILALAMTLALTFALVGCGKSAPAELYTGEFDFVEAGYEGDCINTNRTILVLNSDGTYTLEEGFFVNQVSGAIVYYTKTVSHGTYTAEKPDGDGVKTVSLAAPTSGLSNLNGAITTSQEDSSILSELTAKTLKVNTTSGSIVRE